MVYFDLVALHWNLACFDPVALDWNLAYFDPVARVALHWNLAYFDPVAYFVLVAPVDWNLAGATGSVCDWLVLVLLDQNKVIQVKSICVALLDQILHLNSD